jgi:S-adenosylmethionine-diacylgycerolhomoserine-N-methlytransferase
MATPSIVDADPAARMDRMYRWTRHVYDATRRYYLLGRDRMLGDIAGRPPGAVLEVGCGTARNLRCLHRRAPGHTLCGLDASAEMLATARQSLARAGLTGRVMLARGLAGDLDPHRHFGRDAPFDVVFFAYVLSMIPAWPAAFDAAWTHLRPGGHLYVVDFWDHDDLPGWFASLMQGWLALFGVHHRPALLDYLRRLEETDRARLTLTSVARRYAYVARLEKR